MKIDTADRWHPAPGLAWGLPQPVLRGSLSVRDVSAPLLASLDGFMELLLGDTARWVGQPADEGAATRTPERALLRRVPHWTGALQRHFRIPVAQRAVVQDMPHTDRAAAQALIVLPCTQHKAAAVALRWVLRLLRERAEGHAPDVGVLEQRMNLLDTIGRELSPFAEPGLNPYSIVQAANALDIPVRRLAGRILLLGTGHLARWADSTITDRTPSLGVSIAHHKMHTATVLRQAGLPAPTHELAHSVEAALAAAQRIGWPVVIKPADMEQGNGVAADLRDPDTLAQAWQAAARISKQVLVEKWADGFTHRLTVIGGRIVRVTKRIAGGVTGDGSSTIAELVQALQQREDYQMRARRLGKPMTSLDDEALGLLRQQGRAAQDVPARGEYVRLRRRDNVNAGGTNETCPLDSVHPDNAQVALDAAAALRLDFAGIDLIITDITRSWQEIGALICEVNAQPQVVAPDQPSLYEDILRGMFAQGARVPARLVVCPDDAAQRDTIALRWAGSTPGHGLSRVEGLWMAGRRVSMPFADSLSAAGALLARPDLTHATCLMGAREITRLGLPLNRWSEVVYSREAAPAIRANPPLANMLAAMLAVRTRDEA